jgi:hypothetical protein
MKEVNEVMNTVREFAADDAHIIFGAVYDEGMGEEIRVTVVATGLGQAQAKRQSFEVINTPVMQATGTDGGYRAGELVDIRLRPARRDSGGGAQGPQRDGRSSGQQRRRSVRHTGLPEQTGRLTAGCACSCGVAPPCIALLCGGGPAPC